MDDLPQLEGVCGFNGIAVCSGVEDVPQLKGLGVTGIGVEDCPHTGADTGEGSGVDD